MADSKKLIYAINKFLKSELENGGLSGESAEGVEVGIQCLQAAYGLSDSEPELEISVGLYDIFRQFLNSNVVETRQPTADEKAQAEVFKNEGNTYMTAENFPEAIICYTKAIKLDPTNAVYYCNRAAASNKLSNYESAITDCKKSLQIDPKYCKAYGRLGLAYTNLKQHQEAAKNFQKALELEPDNESYKINLKYAQDALASASVNPVASVTFQNADMATIFTNPGLINMASQMLANPSMQHMMNNILTGNLTEEGGSGMDALLQASQHLAQQMESDNPELVEQLRRQMGGGDGGGSTPDDSPDP